MHKSAILSLLLITSSLVGCGGTVMSGSSGTSSSGSSSSSGSGGGEVCGASNASTLTGVSIEITSTDCTFTLAEAAAGIHIDYQVVVTNDVPGVHPISQDTGCSGPGPSLLYVFENLGDNGQNYCICDQGLCPGSGPDPVTIVQGTYPGSFSWDGKNWSGPSDFNAQKGPAFPPGDYTLTISSKGDWTDAGMKKNYDVTGSVVVHIVP